MEVCLRRFFGVCGVERSGLSGFSRNLPPSGGVEGLKARFCLFVGGDYPLTAPAGHPIMLGFEGPLEPYISWRLVTAFMEKPVEFSWRPAGPLHRRLRWKKAHVSAEVPPQPQTTRK